MSKSVGLYIKFLEDSYNPIEVINSLFLQGWAFNDNGFKNYLPLNDGDDFDWTFDNISDEELSFILREKYLRGERLGVVMTWEETNIGGEFIFESNGLVILSLSINRKTMINDITDINWYIEKIIPNVIKFNNLVYFKFEEVI